MADPMLNIVVIEDNDNLRRSVVRTLVAEGHHVTGVDCVEAFVESPRVLAPDLLVVDLNLPGEGGLSFAARMRAMQPQIGIIILTGRTAPPDKTAGYRNGADIYLTKPISAEELGAAVQALSRRVRPHPVTASPRRLVLRRRTLSGPGGETALSAAETAVLTGLLRAPDQKLEAWQIGELLGKADAIPGRNAINAAVFRLNRKLIDAGAGSRAIRSIRNWGYQLSVRVVADAD